MTHTSPIVAVGGQHLYDSKLSGVCQVLIYFIPSINLCIIIICYTIDNQEIDLTFGGASF